MILLKFAQEIKGSSDVTGYEGWITVDSVQMGVGRSISLSGKDRDTSTPSFSELVLTKSTDIASTELFFQAVCGESLGIATLKWLQTAKDKLQNYLIVELHDAIISSYSVSSGGERPSESFAINFTKITYQFNQFTGAESEEGKPKKWDLMKNKTF
jgi:type VI secretion system secreted protein Hcp